MDNLDMKAEQLMAILVKNGVAKSNLNTTVDKLTNLLYLEKDCSDILFRAFNMSKGYNVINNMDKE